MSCESMITIGRGTTPTYTLTFEEDMEVMQEILVTFSQDFVIKVEKETEDITVDGDTISFRMTQAETLSLSPNVKAYVQVRALRLDGVVVECAPFVMNVGVVLNETIIS